MGRRRQIFFFHNGKAVRCQLTFLKVTRGNVSSGSFEWSFCTSNAVRFAIVFPRALGVVLFFVFGAPIMALFMGGVNAQSELGDRDPSALSSTVVASSSDDDNRTAMGSGACTVMSRLGGLSGRKISLL